MPRGQPAAKRQQGAANQRDTRHENGLVGPGKRVQKQKSNGHLNGHAKQQDNYPPTPPLPATPPHTNGHARQPHTADSAADHKMGTDALRRTSLSGYSESSSSDYSHNTPAISISHDNHRRIDVNAAKNPAVHRDSGPISLALTVLKSCPLADTIAILIVLLQLPPTFLSLVHLLFATLTFVPPPSSPTSGLSFTDIFEGALGTPSVATIVVVDLFVLLIWLFLWGSLQDIALDLAQTVIALTLGGGTSGKEAGMNNVLVCFSIVGVSHLVRSGSIKQSGLRALLSSSAGGLMGSPDTDDPLERSSQSRNKKGTHGWIRSILAIHILAQGLVRYVRDWYVRREKQVNSASIGDPEAGKALADANNDSTTPNTQTPDNDSSTSFPSSTVINSKKKRKQSAQVRIRQPLWAALASTKIVMVKEYETSHTAAESAGTNATDINNLGNAPFNTEADRIWITYVGSDEVFFSTSYFPTYTPADCEERKLDSSGVEKSKPFFVRVNQTAWNLTRINSSTDPEQPAGQDTRWSGEISGLAPGSSYECDFVSTIDGSIIFSTSVRTLQTPTADTTSGLATNPQIAGRPGSPTTTLRTSIATSEKKLGDERSRQKRERKDQRTKLGSVRKELERLVLNLATAGGNDDRLKQKIQQTNLSMKHAEEALISLENELQLLETIPAEEASQYASAKSTYQSHRDAHMKLRAEIHEAKQTADREIQALKNDLATVQQKRERYQARLAKLNAEHDRILEANAKGLDEKERKDKMRTDNEANRASMEAMFMERLEMLNSQIDMASASLNSLIMAIQSFEQVEMYATDSPNASAANLMATASPFAADPNAIPENTAPYAWVPPGPSTAGLYATGGYGAPMAAAQSFRTRGRSSSMLSNVSGFTQSSGEGEPGPSFPIPHMAAAAWGEEADKGSSGSGSASRSGSGSASVGDPKSPVGNGKAALAKW